MDDDNADDMMQVPVVKTDAPRCNSGRLDPEFKRVLGLSMIKENQKRYPQSMEAPPPFKKKLFVFPQLLSFRNLLIFKTYKLLRIPHVQNLFDL